jgi:activator of HSP90 ATPase
MIRLSEITEVIKQTMFIPAKPVQVYDAYINAKKHSDFTGGKATCNPKVGGNFTAWEGYIFGKNLELRKGTKIMQEWTTTEWPKGYPPSIWNYHSFQKMRVLN